MRERLKLLLAIILLLILFMPLVGDPAGANGQQLRDTFRRVRRSVVVVRTVERTVAPLPRQGMVSSAGLASG